MKKITIALLSCALLLSGGVQNVFAGAIWNGASNDCQTVAIANYDTNVGYGNPCWNNSTVSASQNDTVNVRIYYHNSSDINGSGQSATNTRVYLNAPSGTSTTQTFTGRIVSDQDTINFGPVTVNMSSSQSLSFGNVRWYTQNISSVQTALLNGQSGSELISGSGLSLGTIAPGWASQGSVVASFRVSGNSNPTNNCVINDFTVNNSSATTIQQYGTANLLWNTTGCTSVTVSGPGMNSSTLDGTQTVYPGYSGTYILTAYGNNGGTQTRTVDVIVNNNNNNNYCTITNFTINGSRYASVSSNNGVNLSWNTSGCSSVSVSGPNLSTTYGANNSQTVYPNYSGDYTITAWGPNGSVSPQTVHVEVNNNNTHYYDEYCSLINFTVNGSNTATVSSGTPVNLVWNTTGCSSVSVSGPNMNANNSSSGSRYVSPTTSGVYTLTARGTYDTAKSLTVSVNVNQIAPQPPIVYNNTCAVTSIATNVSRNSATLNGLIAAGNTGTTGYFEYGPTINLGYQTAAKTVSTGSIFADTVGTLSPDTSYYYRFVANCQNGTTRGDIQPFVTVGNAVTHTTTIIQGTTVIGTASPVMLKIEDRYETIGVGDTIDYTVTYKNIGKTTLVRPLLQVVVPKGVVLTNASAGTYSNETHTLSVPLENLLAGQDGVVYAQGRVDSLTIGSAKVVSTAILVYTAPNKAQENAIAYVLNTPRSVVTTETLVETTDVNNLGAAAFFLGFFPSTLVGWLLLIILLLILILLTRRYYHTKPSVVVNTGSNGHH